MKSKIAERKLMSNAKSSQIDDSINRPAHYTNGGIETIDFMQAKLSGQQFEGYLAGNVIKYISRYQHKNGVEDLKKARWYLDRLIVQKEKQTHRCPECGKDFPDMELTVEHFRNCNGEV